MRSTRGNPIVKPDQDDGKSGAVATSANASLLLGDKMWEEAGDEANKKSELVLEDDLNEKYLQRAVSMFDWTTLGGIETSACLLLLYLFVFVTLLYKNFEVSYFVEPS